MVKLSFAQMLDPARLAFTVAMIASIAVVACLTVPFDDSFSIDLSVTGDITYSDGIYQWFEEEPPLPPCDRATIDGVTVEFFDASSDDICNRIHRAQWQLARCARRERISLDVWAYNDGTIGNVGSRGLVPGDDCVRQTLASLELPADDAFMLSMHVDIASIPMIVRTTAYGWPGWPTARTASAR